MARFWLPDETISISQTQDIRKHIRIKVMYQLCKEPGAGKPHAGFCRGASFVRGKSTQPKKADLWLWGSLLVKNHILRKMLTDKLTESYPEVHVGIPESSALDVAVGIAAKRAEEG